MFDFTKCTLHAAALLALATGAGAQSGSQLFLIDFEGFAEETPIDDEYAALGITFSIDGKPDAPIIALEGDPTVAYTGIGADAPMSDGIAGLTDPIVDGEFSTGQNIIMTFDPPVTSVRFFVIDIDAAETFTAQAFDGGTEVDAVTRSAGEPGTGNGISVEFFLANPNITSIVLEVPVFSGFAIDFLTFTRSCEGAACGPLIELAQESSPGAGDFDDNVLGTLLSFPTSAGAAGFYAYDVPEGDSWNGQSLTPIVDRSHLLLADTATDGLSLFIVHDRAIPDDPDGGQAEMRFELSGDPDGAFRSVEDDPEPAKIGDGYTGDPGDSIFTAGLEWAPCCTDGLALSDLEGDWSMIVAFTEVDGNSSTAPIEGLNEWVAYSSDGTETPLVFVEDRRVRLRSLGVTCPEDCAEPADGVVNTDDLLALLGQWGQPGTSCDIDGNGTVDTVDLLAVIGAWGPCD